MLPLTTGLLILGWFLGVLINYLSDVLPIARRISPVFCQDCGQTNPVLDYFLLRTCKNCGKAKSPRHWLVVILAAAISCGLWYLPAGRLGFWPGLLVLGFFGLVIVIDIERRLILHRVTLAGAMIGLGIGVWQHGLSRTLLGGAAGFSIMLGLYLFGFLIARWLGKLRQKTIDEEALGFGDVTLGGVLGLMLGWPGITAGLVIAILIGGAGSLVVLALMLLRGRYQAFTAIPYGPFLVLGAVILLFRG